MSESAEERHEFTDTRADSAPSGDFKDDANGSAEAGRSSKLDKVLNRLQGHGSAEHSRESSPDPSGKDGGSGRSSRRKPKVTRKVVDDENPGQETSQDDDVVDDAMNLAIQEFLNSSSMDKAEEHSNQTEPADKERASNNDKDESIDVDEDGNLILPEGTVVVEPEAVTDSKPVFKGPEFRTSDNTFRKNKTEIDLNLVHCTACNHQINTNSSASVKRHPVLKVILCKRCYTWYTSDEIIQDKDGMDEQCRWCGDGGDLLCCDFCHNAFCKACIRRNLGRGELSALLNAGEDTKWHCYVCDPKPLAELIHNCNQIIEAVEQREKKLQEKEFRKDEERKKKRSPTETVRQPQRKSGRIGTPVIQRQGIPHRSQTVMNLLKTAQQNMGQKQPHPVGVIKAMNQSPKGMQQMGLKSGMHASGQAAGNSTFVEWNFRINENNVMPIIDRAMMVTESMHMLLSSLRDDVQKASTASTSQRTMIKGESAGKLRRALTAFNKSFFDLGTFSQKTSTPVTVRKMIDEQTKFKSQQRGTQQPVRPVQLVQHGQQLVMLPSGATVVQPAKHVQPKQVRTKKSNQRPKPVSSGEVIELLDSDDESKPKTHGMDNPGEPGTKSKVAVGGPGHKLKGPLSKRRRIDEHEAKSEQRVADREDKSDGGMAAEDDQVPSEEKDKENNGNKMVDGESEARESVGQESSQMDATPESGPNERNKHDENIGSPTAQANDCEMSTNDNTAEDADSRNSAESEGSDKQAKADGKPSHDKDLDDVDDLENFKNIEEQLKQLNGSIDEPSKVNTKRYEDGQGGHSDDEQMDNSYSSVDNENVPQLDGVCDSLDSSSNSNSPQFDSHPRSPDKKTLDTFAASVKFEPLLNLDSLTSGDSDDDSAIQGIFGFDSNQDSNSEDTGLMSDGLGEEGGLHNSCIQDDAEQASSGSERGQLIHNDSVCDGSEDQSCGQLDSSNISEDLLKLTSQSKRLREDIEAQRQLHQELLDAESNESSDEEESVFSGDDSSDEHKKQTKKKNRIVKIPKRKKVKENKNDTGINTKPMRSDRTHKGDGKDTRKTKSGGDDDKCVEPTSVERKEKADISEEDSLTNDTNQDTKQAASRHRKKSLTTKDRKTNHDGERGSDSELSSEIEHLSRRPMIRKSKKGSSRGGDSGDEHSDETERKEDNTKKIKASVKAKNKKDLVAGLSSEDEEEEEDEDDQEDLEEPGDLLFSGEQIPLNKSVDDSDEDATARKDLLADASSDDDTDDEFGIDEKVHKKKEKPEDDSEISNHEEEDYDSEEIIGCQKKKLSTSLLRSKLSDSESDASFKIDHEASSESESSEETSRKRKKENKESDSTDDASKKVKKKRKQQNSTSSEENLSDSEDTKKKKKKRRRVKFKSESSTSDGDNSSEEEAGGVAGKKKKKIRKIIKDKKLSEETKSASQAEEARRQRVKERQKLYNFVEQEDDITSPTKCPVITKLVLEVDKDKNPVIEVNRDLVRKLKPHQVEAVQFMWDCVAETTERLQNEPGSGCILAHCMGLGKTLSVITLISTLLAHEEKTKIHTCLVVCPLNTILNWQTEFEKWLPEEYAVNVWQMSNLKDNYMRTDALKEWYESGGVMIIGYDMYRNLSNHKNIRKKKLKDILTETLVDPGPDIVICDEGHVLKNDSSALSKAMNKIRTQRRIVLTGTPLQNNLIEYHCMVDFIKPKLLGTRKEFTNRFVNPINNGQCSDASSHDVKLMKRRAHILHETLAGCIQRRDYSALTKYLMPKYEYIISVRLSPVQIELYQKYLDIFVERGRNEEGSVVNKNASLFADYNNLMKIWTHPWSLKLDEIRQEQKCLLNDDSESSFIDDNSTDITESESESTVSSDDSDSKAGASKNLDTEKQNGKERRGHGRRIRTRGGGGGDTNNPSSAEEDVVSKDWWGEYVSEDDRYKAELGGKIMVLAEILKMCDSIGDKVLVFSKSLLSLDLIEDFLEYWDQSSKTDPENQMAGTGSWVPGVDYYRMDGSTSAQTRKSTVACFNDPDNPRMRLFLISTRAGCLGINLVSANRVIVFDASWNPTHDVQSIFRVFRFGQTKPVYVYRLLAQGTMEEKIYERQVTKQSLSQRVVDEHQIERHFSSADLQELYTFKPDRLDDPNREEPPVPKLPKDRLLAELLTNCKEWIYNYHEHDSLLENREEENLTEEEKKAAWEEYEAEKQGIIRRTVPTNMNPTMYNQYGMMGLQQASLAAEVQNIAPEAEQIARAIYASNPGISQEMLKQRVHAYLQQRLQQYRLFMMHQEEQRRMQQELIKLQQIRMERQRQENYLTGRYSGAGQQVPVQGTGQQGKDSEESEKRNK